MHKLFCKCFIPVKALINNNNKNSNKTCTQAVLVCFHDESMQRLHSLGPIAAVPCVGLAPAQNRFTTHANFFFL